MASRAEFAGAPLTDHEVSKFRQMSERTVFGTNDEGTRQKRVEFGAETAQTALTLCSRDDSYHPVREYLLGLTPEPSIDAIGEMATTLGQVGFGRELVRMWAIGCVARVMSPGCQLDTVLILVSEKQGVGKSTFFRTLAGPEWFSDTMMDIESKDSLIQLGSTWIYEWGELASISGKRSEMIKQFATTAVDKFRMPYARFDEWHPRSMVFVGTTNHKDFLNDSTGERRWWPIEVGRINLDRVRALRDLFWAEAVEAYQLKERYWIDPGTTEEIALEELHGAVRFHDAWEASIEAWAEKAEGPITVARVLVEAIGMARQDIQMGTTKRCAGILRQLGWSPGTMIRHGGTRIRPWKRPKVRDV
jgi:predicted P-loop ATPase